MRAAPSRHKAAHPTALLMVEASVVDAGGIDGLGGSLNSTLKWPEQAGHSRAVEYGLSPATG